ncbi:MAG TPA: hypothetical protein VME46_17740 [Acidimicrobiales bacterium]|nr:hypothetical protein [Acidimicrobiales bacterium]
MSTITVWRRRPVALVGAALCSVALLSLPVVANTAAGASAVPRVHIALAKAACVWAEAPDPALPVLTTAQASSDMHTSVSFAGSSGPLKFFDCAWEGAKVAKNAKNPYGPHYTADLQLDLEYAATPAAALHLYDQARQGWCGAAADFTKDGCANIAHLGSAAFSFPGQDVIQAQLYVLVSHYVFWLGSSATFPVAAQKADLLVAAHQVVTRLSA